MHKHLFFFYCFHRTLFYFYLLTAEYRSTMVYALINWLRTDCFVEISQDLCETDLPRNSSRLRDDRIKSRIRETRQAIMCHVSGPKLISLSPRWDRLINPPNRQPVSRRNASPRISESMRMLQPTPSFYGRNSRAKVTSCRRKIASSAALSFHLSDRPNRRLKSS